MQKGLRKYFLNMDDFLSSLGLYRKMVARDASSLFRAVSEQLYYSQNYHLRIRQDCADFMRANRCNFEPFVEGSFDKYLERLEDPKETVGQVEIRALSQLYRRCFVIYRFPGKPATLISEDDYMDKVTLCCSINGHYDIIYPRSYPAAAALCQSILYELLYTEVFGLEEAELCQAMEAFRVGGQRCRNSTSVCSDMEVNDTPEDRGHREELEAEGVAGADVKPTAEATPPSRLSLPYKVIKSLDGDAYRNLEFDVWQDTCKEMQKMDYMVFAGRQYFLGDKCQVRLEPKGKFYNAFIQEVGTQPSAVTVFIEELGEKHLVPLTDLKPVNPVPAMNVSAPIRKDLDVDSRGQRSHRHRYFRKSRSGGGGKGAELVMTTSSYVGHGPSGMLPPRFQPAGHTRPPSSQSVVAFNPYAPPHHQPAAARASRYGAARGSTRLLNRHLIGPQLTYYHPGRRFYQDYENFPFRSRRSRRQLDTLSKECQFSYSLEGEEQSLEPALSFYPLDEASSFQQSPAAGPPPTTRAPPTPPGSSYRVQRGSMPPASQHGLTPVCSSEDEQVETSTAEDQVEYSEEFLYVTPDETFQTSGVYTPVEPQTKVEPEGGDSRSDMSFSYTPQVVKSAAVICSSPSSSSSSSPSSGAPGEAHLPLATPTRSVAIAMPPASPWLVSELGEPPMAPPPYSYDPNGSDLPRDCRVLQYYYNLGVQWCSQQVYSPHPVEGSYLYQHYNPYLSQEASLQAAPPPHPESAGPVCYPESSRGGDLQPDPDGGPALPSEGSALSSALLYLDQTAPPPLLHLPYEAPPPLPYAPPTPHPHHAPLPQPSAFHPCPPLPTHWGALQPGGHAPRIYYSLPLNPPHLVSYLAAPPPHHPGPHYLTPSL